jgi:uncharacterized protein (TIGR03435 family)
MRAFVRVGFAVLLSGAAFGQAAESTPKFDLADVHASAKGGNNNVSGGILRDARYDLRNATIVDLIQIAYSLDDSKKIVGGPNWLDTDRFDIAAKAPPDTQPETIKLMLQALLADRFKLVVHMDSKPMSVFVLSLGKGKPKLKESDGKGESNCQGQPQNRETGEIPYQMVACRNMTMEQFAQRFGMAGNYVTAPGVDQTGLKGAWDFDIKWTGRGQLAAAGSNGITFFDAIDKQLGLKLEPGRLPMPVLVVDSVNQKPTDNSPGVTSNLPPPPPPEFEVASIRPSAPDARENFQVRNGRVDLQAARLKDLIEFAWNVESDDFIADGPKFLDSAKFDVIAKASSAQVDDEDLRLMTRALLVDRFKMATHMETRTISVYTLSSAKPKLQKADPANRSACGNGPGPDGKDPRLTNPVNARLVTCLNTTMAQLAASFQNFAGGYIHNSVVDATGIEGAYDFTLNFAAAGVANGRGRGGDAAGDGAADPSGAISLFDAVNKQLGLKLEQQKRPVPVLVIDHVEEKPTDN